MSRVFMDFAASGETLFKTRCGAKDFFDKLSIPLELRSGGMLYATPCAVFRAAGRSSSF